MFVDSHCHLDFDCFIENMELLLQELQQKSINKIIIPATQADGWERIITLSQSNPEFYYALGIHPHFLSSFDPQHLVILKNKLIRHDDKAVALGEIGLDKYAPSEQALQEFVFVEQLKIAQEIKLPIILHCVKMQSRVLALLKEQNFTQGGVYHAFSGSLEIANAFIKLGFKLGIGGVITYPSAIKTRQTVSRLPIESILLETDAPDMPLYQQVTQDNSPINIVPIFDCLASLRSEPKAQLATHLYTNVCNIFSLGND